MKRAIPLAIALAAAPAYTLRFKAGPLPTTLLEVLLLVGIAVAVAGQRGALPWHNPYTWPGLLLLAGATVGVLVSPDRTGALGEWRAFFVEPMAAGLAVAALASGEARRLVLEAGLAVAGCLSALVNLVGGVPKVLSGHFDVANPPVAIYQNANQLALFLVPLDALALALLLLSGRRAERLGAAAFLMITVPAVLLSYSRGGIAALAISLLLVGLFHPRRTVITLPIAALLAAGVAIVPGIRRRVLVEFDPHSPNNTLNARLDLWRGTLKMLEHRPLQGAGLRGFDERLAPYFHDPFKVAFPHDIVLNFWSETGLGGLAGFVWLSATAVVTSARTPAARALGVGVIGFVAAVWIHGLVDVPYLKNDLALVFWAVLGLHAGAIRGAAA